MKRRESKESAPLEEKHISLESLMAKLGISDDMPIPLSPDCTIYKVPPKLRKENEEAYNPTVISIGPYHCKDPTLKSMHELKLWYVHKFLKRTQKNLLSDDQAYVKAVRDREDEIRRSYSENIPMQSDELVNMILTDACFIIEFFLESTDPSEKDPLVKKPWPTEYIKLDLLLLENQLPFFVLDDLFNLAFLTGLKNVPSFVELSFKFFKKDLLREINPNLSNQNFNYFKKHYLDRYPKTDHHRRLQVCHLNDMLRMLYLPHSLPHRKPIESGPVKPICSASQLREAGITFKPCRESLTELTYSNKVLTIPCFLVRDWTETMIRNVIAFEQCHHHDSSFVTDYIVLWDHLINTEKDVEMLVRKEIIKNFLSDNNALASLVNSLCRHVVTRSYNRKYIQLIEDLNEFYNACCRKHKAVLCHDYCSSPWRIASVVAAVLLLLLTLIQTICSVMALFSEQ